MLAAAAAVSAGVAAEGVVGTAAAAAAAAAAAGHVPRAHLSTTAQTQSVLYATRRDK